MHSGQWSQRDPRVDVLRGLALVMIFFDHVPGNLLGYATLHMFGFSDAAELFVILAGFSSMAAYGRAFEQDGVRSGLVRVAKRCARLYLFQVGLLLLTFAIVQGWGAYKDVRIPELLPFLNFGRDVVKHGLALHALPAKLDILPLYMVLMALFPLIYLGMHKSIGATLGVSALVWLAAGLDHRVNFSNWIDGKGWFFNPFAWQFIFVIGAAGARLLPRFGGSLPRIDWLAWVCWAYLAFALLASAPWASWGIADFRPIPMATPDKSSLHVLRILHILAIMYLALSSRWFLAVSRKPIASGLDVCGRHSLEVFSLATLLALIFGLPMTTFASGAHWPMQIAVNLLGVGAMVALAAALEKRKHRGVPREHDHSHEHGYVRPS